MVHAASPNRQVTFVGTIVNIAKSATNVSSTIEDGTGSIDVRQWTDTADDDTGKMAGIEYVVRLVLLSLTAYIWDEAIDVLFALLFNHYCRQGMYVRVHGDLKSFNNRRSVNATSIKKVTDHNEIQYHLLETVYVHLYHTRGPVGLLVSVSESTRMVGLSICFYVPSLQAQAGAAGHGIQGQQRAPQQQQQRTGADPYAVKLVEISLFCLTRDIF